MDNGKLSTDLIPGQLRQLFEQAAHIGVPWDSATVDAAKKQLKAILFEAQNGKCAYCRRMISDEPGHVEIDHILPKNPAGNQDHWGSNEAAHRRSTAGYAHLRFEPLNLALACKLCNNKKGTHDGRKDRGVPSVQFELDDQFYEWIHIYAHSYHDHIEILQGLIYQVRNKSACGDAVISVCKLDKVAAVERASAELTAKTAKTVAVAIGRLIHKAELLGWDVIVEVVAKAFPQVGKDAVENLASSFRALG